MRYARCVLKQCVRPCAGAKDVAVVKRFPVTLGPDGMLSIIFVATQDQATVAGIEVSIWEGAVWCSPAPHQEL